MNPPRRGTPDFLLLLLTLILVSFGLIMVFSASSMSATYWYQGDSLFYTKKQVLGIVLGIIGMFIVMNIHFSTLRKWTGPIFTMILISLFLVLVVGYESKGAKSWFMIGGLQLQPAEFAKVGIVMFLAAMIAKKEEKFRDFKQGLLPALLVIGLVVFLILQQPDLGSAMILAMGALLVIVVGGANLKHLLMLGTALAALGSIVFFIMYLIDPDILGGYRIARITTFLDPWVDERGDGFHIVQSLLAFGHGGLTGAGFGQSIQKLHFLPAPHNDFIFSIIGEELGFIGSSIFIIVYLLFIWRGFIVALRCSDTFGSLLGIGIIGTMAIQSLINIGGVTNSIPLTGVTLPLISYGGTSVMVTLASLGILLGISRDYNKAAQEALSGSGSGRAKASARRHTVSG
ncbi:MAG: cell division protein FtsW [Paenibacillaceae bacterium]|jgi:cell division protein FtsW|nr:cell division protein FtsW [Paenibacillaceae bacterium]